MKGSGDNSDNDVYKNWSSANAKAFSSDLKEALAKAEPYLDKQSKDYLIVKNHLHALEAHQNASPGFYLDMASEYTMALKKAVKLHSENPSAFKEFFHQKREAIDEKYAEDLTNHRKGKSGTGKKERTSSTEETAEDIELVTKKSKFSAALKECELLVEGKNQSPEWRFLKEIEKRLVLESVSNKGRAVPQVLVDIAHEATTILREALEDKGESFTFPSQKVSGLHSKYEGELKEYQQSKKQGQQL